MKLRVIWCFLLLFSAAASASEPEAFERQGNIFYRGSDGGVSQLTRGTSFGEPRLSPNGRTVAFIRQDSYPTEEGELGATSLWIADLTRQTVRSLLRSRPSKDVAQDLTSFGKPIFSLDGGFVYIAAQAWATSTAIHQVNVSTGKTRFVVAGSLRGVLRNGPFRGFLVVNQHRYHPAPDFGSYNPDFIVRPDGKEILRVPGTEVDDGRDRLWPWLKLKGWTL